MNWLFLLTYYRPHISGLTQSAANRAEALAARGHSVTVLTSQHAALLPMEEEVRGVRVLRRPVALRAGKGVLMSGYHSMLGDLMEASDAVVLWLPATPPEAWSAARWARRLGKPLVIDYACDLRLPGTWTARLLESIAGWGHGVAAEAACAIVVGTEDYAAGQRVRVAIPGQSPDRSSHHRDFETGSRQSTCIARCALAAGRKADRIRRTSGGGEGNRSARRCAAADRRERTQCQVAAGRQRPYGGGRSRLPAEDSRSPGGTAGSMPPPRRCWSPIWRPSTPPAMCSCFPAATVRRVSAWCRRKRCCAARPWWRAICPE